MPILLISSVFKALMLFDVIRRGGCCNNSWYFIIVLVPFGEWIYFFSVKIHDPQMQRLKKRLVAPWLNTAKDITEYRFLYRETPSLLNRLNLARALHDTGQFVEASEHFQAIYDKDPRDIEAKFGLALSHLGRTSYAVAVQLLKELVDPKLDAKDYKFAEALVDALWQSEARTDSVALAERMYDQSRRLNHVVILAEKYIALEEMEKATQLLEDGISSYKRYPTYAQRANRSAASHAHRMVRDIAKQRKAVMVS
jgi:hypothetical protein